MSIYSSFSNRKHSTVSPEPTSSPSSHRFPFSEKAKVNMAGELKADPRTGLEIIDIPADHEKYFRDLKGCLIHWFGVVDKYNRVYKIQKRVAIVSDQCIYLCRTDGSITRCVNIQAIQEILLTEQTAIGFRVGPPDFDMLIAVDTVQEREAIVHIVSKVFWSLVGQDLVIRRLSGDSGEAVSQNLQLTKPKGWQPNIIPMKTTKALSKLLSEKEMKENEDRRIVQEEFERIKQGLRAQLEQYRSEEYERMVDQLSQYVKALEDKDVEIAKLKENSVSLDDPEVWKKCPNCAQLRRVLESHPNDDKQKILRLEREIESQRHIVEHLQAAIQHRSGNGRTATLENASDSSQVVVLRQELVEATRKNKELQQLILDSPYLTSDVKNKATRMTLGTSGGGSMMNTSRGLQGGGSAVGGGAGSVELQEALAEKDREIRHLKSVLRDSTFRQVQELESIRTQFQQYDAQIVEYLEKVFSGQVSVARGTPKQMANATAEAARHAATPSAFGPQNSAPSAAYNQSAITSSPFRQFVAPADSYLNDGPSRLGGGGGGGGYSLAASAIPPAASPGNYSFQGGGGPGYGGDEGIRGGRVGGAGGMSPIPTYGTSNFTPATTQASPSRIGGMWSTY
jgi:hypothetical protein